MFLMLVIVLWYFVVSVLTFPFYISYFNETIGGSINGYKYVADSNLDWGQDLKRLAEYVEENNIEIIKVDDFWRLDLWVMTVPVVRDYFRLVQRDGNVVTVFRDLQDNSWYRQNA